MIKSPVLSICIPTYNRAGILDKTLSNLTSQKKFINTNDVEIVISDNNSNDGTQKIVEKYIRKFPDKIIYSRNETNIKDLNFEKVISLSNGQLAKLHNDTLLIKENCLENIVRVVKENLSKKPVIFFLNNSKKIKRSNINNLDEFIKEVSYFSTWIGGFCIWKEDYLKLKNFSRLSTLQLSQVDVLFRIITSGKKTVIINQEFFKGVSITRKGGYNVAEVFGRNYLSICNDFVLKGFLSKKVLEKEKKILLLKHIIPFYFDFYSKYHFHNTGYFKFLFQDYKFNGYFYFSLINITLRVMVKWLINLITKRRNPSWKKLNKHNHTAKVNNFDNTVVTVGKHTYGPLKVLHYLNPEEKLIIGNYVSIAQNVTFVLGGNHQYDNISTYPFKVMMFNDEYESFTKGPIIVEDDVWIGYGSIILSGVTLGKGSIVGAGSVVSKNVPPYSIVVGNPAKIIKYRFPANVIEKLLDFNFDNLDEQNIKNNLLSFYTKIDSNNIDTIVGGIMSAKNK